MRPQGVQGDNEMKKTIFTLCLALGACVQYTEPATIKSCVTFYTRASQTDCTGDLAISEEKEYCENVKSAAQCQDVKSCFAGDYALFNRFEGSADCVKKAYTKGCGDGVFVAADAVCP